MKYLLLFLSIFLLSAECVRGADGLREAIETDLDYLIPLYEELHRNPELSFQEARSAKRMAEEMRAAGFEVTEKIGVHGVVGVFRNGEGPTVMVRGDMDALPVEETTGLPYASAATAINDKGEEVSVMHACGHDVHMTVLVGVGRQLMEMKDDWTGTLMLVAQPAEEVGGGAKAMLEDGLFERFPKPDFVLGMHVHPERPTGVIEYLPGYAMANVDSVDITIYGVGGHGAYPHLSKDPIVLSAQIINALQTLVSREISPVESGVVTVGSIRGGTKNNVIPDEVRLQLTVRSYADAVRQQLLKGIERIARNQALVMGFPEDKLPKVEIKESYTPALYNDPELTLRAAELLKARFGEDNVVKGAQRMGGEDFSRYARADSSIAAVYLRVGAVDPKTYAEATARGEPLPSLHSSAFAPVPKPTIATGVETLSAVALDLLGEGAD